MKKFNLKSLLILVLSLLLIFSLVACGSKGGDNNGGGEGDVDPTEIKSTQFFNDLWAASNSIGSTEIKSTDDIAISADLTLAVKVRDKKEVYKEISLGVALQVVFDRDMANTAIKAQLYNAKNDTNWLTLYYYFNDAKNIYIDYQGQNIKFYLDADGENENFAGYIGDFLDNDVFGETSIVDILNAITNTTGEKFDLNSLINVIINIITQATSKNENPFDIAKLIADNKDLIENTLGINKLYDKDTGINLLAVFNSDIIKGFIKNPKCVEAEDGTKAYSANIKLSTTISNALASALKEFGDIITGISVNLAFGVDNNSKIDGFTLTASLPGLTATDSTIGTKGASVYPEVVLNIKELEFAPCTASSAQAKSYFGMTKTYSEDISLDASVVLTTEGITLHPAAVNSYSKYAAQDVKLDGTYVLNIKGNGNVGAQKDFYVYASIEKAYPKVDGKASEPIVQVGYNGEKVILTIDDSVKTSNGESIVETIIDSLGTYVYKIMTTPAEGETTPPVTSAYGEALKSALLKVVEGKTNEYEYKGEGAAKVLTLDFDLIKFTKWATETIGAKINEATAQADAYPFNITKLTTIAADIYSAISTDDGLTVSLKSKSIMATMIKWFNLNGAKSTTEKWYPRMFAYNQQWADIFTDFGYIDKAYYEVSAKAEFDETATYYTYDDETKKYSLAEITKFAIDTKYYTQGNALYTTLNKEQTEFMFNVVYAYASANGDATKLSAILAMKDKDSKGLKAGLTTEDLKNAFESLDLLFGNRFLSFEGIADKDWYKAVFEDINNVSVNLSLDNGLKINVNGTMESKVAADLTLELNASKTLTKAQVKALYDGLAALENPVSIGEIYFGETAK